MPAYDALLTLKTQANQAASTNGVAIDLGHAVPNGGQLMQFDLFWNAIAGTSADVIIEESPDSATWRQVTQFRTLTPADANFVGANLNGKKMPRFGLVTQRFMRYRSALGAGSNLNFALYARGMDAVGREIPLMSL